MFYDRYVNLCKKNKVSASKAAEDNGLSRTSVVKWKKGAVPSGATIQKLATYFGVTADYLLGNVSERYINLDDEQRNFTFNNCVDNFEDDSVGDVASVTVENNICDRIRELANSRRLSLTTLEENLHFGKGTIRKWDSSSPSADKLQKVADYFDVSVDFLLGREKSSDLSELEGTYFRLAKGAKDLNLTDDDVDAILNLYKKHQEKNR